MWAPGAQGLGRMSGLSCYRDEQPTFLSEGPGSSPKRLKNTQRRDGILEEDREDTPVSFRL
jgi:hypothetical protein